MKSNQSFKNFEIQDYRTVVNFYNTVNPNNNTSTEHMQEFDEKRQVKRVLVIHHDNLLAYYDYRANDNSKENGLVLNIVCDNTIESDYLEKIYVHLQGSIKLKPSKHLIAKVSETETTLLNFYQSQGFAEEERMWPSTLELGTFDVTILAGSIAKAQSHGISFKTLTNFKDDTTTQRMLYNLVKQCLKDVPTQEETNVWSFEVWKERFWNSNNRQSETNFLAFDGAALVGVSQLIPDAKIGNIRTGLTGVLATYRGKGIAKALKLLATKYAIKAGYSTISTYNHSINQPMLAINEAMGYVKSPALVILRKELS